MPNEWYTIQTLSGQEMKAEKSLRKRIVEEEMDEYIDELVNEGRLSEDRIYATLFKEEDHI